MPTRTKKEQIVERLQHMKTRLYKLASAYADQASSSKHEIEQFLLDTYFAIYVDMTHIARIERLDELEQEFIETFKQPRIEE